MFKRGTHPAAGRANSGLKVCAANQAENSGVPPGSLNNATVTKPASFAIACGRLGAAAVSDFVLLCSY